MDGANGTALEWALALLRAPAERYRLRQRPLPPGVGELLAVAANVAPEEAELAAVRLRESVEMLREAARFYAREVLFHAEADPYRMLGVPDDASVEEIKTHHRLLQAWLHPDREQSGDDSVFAARINTAWNQLRSSERRAAYDAEQATVRLTAGVEIEMAGVATPPAGLWHPPPPTAPAMGRRRHRVLVFGLLGACLLLGGLVLRESERTPEPWARNGALAPAANRSESAPESSGSAAVMEQLPEPRAASIDTAARLPAAPSSPEIEPPQPASDSGKWAIAMSGRQGSIESQPAPAAPAAAPKVRPPVVAGTERRGDVRQRRDLSLPGLSAASPARTATATPAGHASASQDPNVAATQPDASAARSVASAGTAVPEAEEVAASNHDSLLGRLRQAFGRRSQTRATPDLGVEGDVAFDRIQQARQVGQQLLRYLASANRTPPPIWDSAATLDRADGLRNGLHHAGSPKLGAPQWRIGKTSAVLTSDYRIGGAVQGTLTAAVVWRDDRWLVTSVALETGP